MFQPYRNMVVMVGAALFVCGTVKADAVPGQDRRAVLDRQREHYLQTLRSQPLLDQHHISDVLELKVDRGQLLFSTPLTPRPNFEARRVELEEMSLPASIVYAQFVANNASARQFDFRVEDYPDSEVYGQLHVQWRPSVSPDGELSIEQTEQTSHSFLRVFYMQSPGSARLLVFSNDASTDHNMQSFNYQEKDFVTLRQAHASEVEQWLRPMLHRLGQEAAFAPDGNAAWQVLSADWPYNSLAREAALRLIPDLNDEKSAVRNRAFSQLVALGYDGASAISQLDRRGLSLEQNVRLDEVLGRFRRLKPQEAESLSQNADFLLDCQYSSDPTIRRLAANRLASVLGHPVELASIDSEPQRIVAIEKLRRELHPSPTTQPVPVSPDPPLKN